MLTGIRAVVALLLAVLLMAQPAAAAELPTDHPYQKTLRDYLATLSAEELSVEPKAATLDEELDEFEQFRLYQLTQTYGTASPAVLAVPGEFFTLDAIEGGDQVRLPRGVQPEVMAWFADWDFAGNPYHDSEAVKKRAFVYAAVDMIMHDHLHESDDKSANRSDFLGGTLIWLAYVYSVSQDVLPADVQRAYETGLKKFAERIIEWGPEGAMTDMDLFAPVGFLFTMEAMDVDDALREKMVAYSRELYTDPKYYDHAGYFVDNRAFDVSYNGISLFFNAWTAALSDWPFVHKALNDSYRLRSFLSLPEPGGGLWGPTHMSSRTSADSPHDQWSFHQRHLIASQLTDEAIYAVEMASPQRVDGIGERMVDALNQAVAQTPEGSIEENMQPWGERHWTHLPNFGYLNLTREHYERLRQLKTSDDPLTRPRFTREGDFAEQFGEAFVIARQQGLGVVIFTGQVGEGHRAWKRPYGFGGGSLSALWSEPTGSVLLGRRRGIQGRTVDSFDEWRTWPVHTVIGVTKEGGVFTPSRIRKPDVTVDLSNAITVTARGEVPRSNIAQGQVLSAAMDYQRTFELKDGVLTTRVALTYPAADEIAEMYEVLPVFVDGRGGEAGVPLKIEFEVDGRWVEAGIEPAKITRARVTRHDGAMVFSFKSPVKAKLSPELWIDGYQSQVACRNVLIDLLGGASDTKMHRSFDLEWSVERADADE